MSTHGIQYAKKQAAPTLESFADADVANYLTRLSKEGAVHVAFGAPIRWKSKQHKTVSLYTCEAEHLAASDAIQGTMRIDKHPSIPPQLKSRNPIPFNVEI